MYSQCPECLTRFRVTAAALRAAHGTVRCGRCGSAFDALPRLSDTLQETDAGLGPAQPAELGGQHGLTVATAAGLIGERVDDVPEFQFSADDIENVFIDVRDWQSQFGTSSLPVAPGGTHDQASNAELDQLLEDRGSQQGQEPADGATDATESKVWVHEPESVEDITLEGERIEIEGFAGFEEDFLEREIERELDEQHRAEITGSQRLLTEPLPEPDEASAPPFDDAVPLPGIEPLHDLDSTDEFEALREDEALSTGIDVEAAHASASEPLVAEPAMSAVETSFNRAAGAVVVVPAMPAAVAAAAAGLAQETPASRPAAPWRRFPEPAANADDDEHDQQLADDLATVASARRASWGWGVGSFLFALLLSAQLVHHFRLQLARDPSIGPALRAAYERIGRPLPPNWSLAAFELRQWGASDAAPTTAGAMTVRASIRNGAAFAQPMPLLRLELEDRFGSTVARRDFAPREYLKDPAQAGRRLEPNAATEAELAIVGATAEAVGYRLDVCLREETGNVRCAQAGESASSTPASQAPQ